MNVEQFKARLEQGSNGFQYFQASPEEIAHLRHQISLRDWLDAQRQAMNLFREVSDGREVVVVFDKVVITRSPSREPEEIYQYLAGLFDD